MEEEIGENTETETEILALPQAFLCSVQISPLVTNGKAIPVGQKGERREGEDKLRE